jgi:hypothetical protein
MKYFKPDYEDWTSFNPAQFDQAQGEAQYWIKM